MTKMNTNIAELENFCNSWLRKAKMYTRPTSRLSIKTRVRKTVSQFTGIMPTPLSRSFDRFTSLFVVFNRVYMEAGQILVRQKILKSPRQRYAPLPDRTSATEYIVTFYGEDNLRNAILASPKCKQAVDHLVQLITNGNWYLHEDYTTGLPDVQRDLLLARKAGEYSPQAILSLIYQARCNLFHGQKVFEEAQRDLLDNMSLVLEFITIKTFAKLKSELRNM